MRPNASTLISSVLLHIFLNLHCGYLWPISYVDFVLSLGHNGGFKLVEKAREFKKGRFFPFVSCDR
jgi:hypothetical protein